MTTTIYFFLMSASLFVVPQLLVRFVVGEPVWDKRIRFLVYAAAIPILWHLLVPKEMNDIRQINFLQHALGGGVPIGLISLYFISIFRDKFNPTDSSGNIWNNYLFQTLLIFACVSSFGVANELLEFLLDYAGIGIFSADRYDVWFDLAANTLGSFSVFLFWKLINVFRDGSSIRINN